MINTKNDVVTPFYPLHPFTTKPIFSITNYNLEGERLKEIMAKEFEIKLKSLRFVLGMEIITNKIGIPISQRNRVFEVLKEIEIVRCKLIELYC